MKISFIALMMPCFCKHPVELCDHLFREYDIPGSPVAFILLRQYYSIFSAPEKDKSKNSFDKNIFQYIFNQQIITRRHIDNTIQINILALTFTIQTDKNNVLHFHPHVDHLTQK